MKLAVTLKFSLLATILTPILAFYAPVSATVMIVFAIITIRFIVDLLVVNNSKKSRGTKCELYKASGKEFFYFLVAYLAIIFFIYPTDIHLLAFFGSKNFIVTKIAAVLIIAYEAIIINLRFKVLTGESIGERLMKVVKLARTAKKIKDDLQE